MTTWISRVDPAPALPGPLHGLRFAVKDNIDVTGVPTTAGDPRRTTPATGHAPVVDRLVRAGAVVVGKTNLDQYATGLVGTRSPYGACSSVLSDEHVSGGSSSGSAVAVARGEVDFALGTDTAGSGRVPAAFNGIVGIKPSKGLVSTRGVVPACRTLDCVTVFARDVTTARAAYEQMVGYDAEDPYSRRLEQRAVPASYTIGVPDLPLDLDPEHAAAWAEAVTAAEALGEVRRIDVGAFLEAARLLYSGPWLAERWLAFGDALDEDDAVDPTVRSIVRNGASLTAADAFAGLTRLAELARQSEAAWAEVDVLLLPVTPGHPTLAEVAGDPIGVNSRLGTFTNMTNLLDLCAIAVPGPARSDGLPFGVQLLAPAGGDDLLAELGARWCGEPGLGLVTPAGDGDDEQDTVLLAVAGAHLSGQPLNDTLVSRGAALVSTTRTARDYRMFLVDGPLPRPGLTRLPRPTHAPGRGLEVEVWRLPARELGGFATTVAAPLALGPLELADGSEVLGFLCTADAARADRDITRHGGWRAYLAWRAHQRERRAAWRRFGHWASLALRRGW
ncbi:allophanate hydrolase [Nocardioides aromaticivorans]|uniref:Allophanate hydrolase n=1 Tax=Nocardioides aromaticivorans TaxID=200618 RepID=A0ABX7PRD9_9ACTN|nr:allophanate hydrolase [Nocardioides aromaticivorans]QSR28496.1 allophanate hydrolase [Nocardioides aromaticivorans]